MKGDIPLLHRKKKEKKKEDVAWGGHGGKRFEPENKTKSENKNKTNHQTCRIALASPHLEEVSQLWWQDRLEESEEVVMVLMGNHGSVLFSH